MNGLLENIILFVVMFIIASVAFYLKRVKCPNCGRNCYRSKKSRKEKQMRCPCGYVFHFDK